MKEHLSLLPCYIGNISEGLTDLLNGKIFNYSGLYGGVLLSYSKPKLMQRKGIILDEQPHIHFDMIYTAYIFRPVIGSILCGRVNKVGVDHVGCLLYNCFNVSVIWKEHNSQDNFSLSFEDGSLIWFRVITLDLVGHFLSLTGEYCDPYQVKQIRKEKRKHFATDVEKSPRKREKRKRSSVDIPSSLKKRKI